MGRAIEEKFVIHQDDSDVTQADGTSSVMSDIYDFQVPVGVSIVLLPEHKLRLYLEDSQTTPVVMPDADVLQIEVRDSVAGSKEIIYGPAPYVVSKEFQDIRKIATLDLAGPLKLKEGDHIVLMANLTGQVIDASDGRLALDALRFREGVGR